MSIVGKISQLFLDKEKTQPAFPITKCKAVTNDKGQNLQDFGVTAEDIVPDPETAPINADTLNGQLPEYYAPWSAVTNRNLLDNWYFGNPINQRGKISAIPGEYIIDRWKLYAKGVVSIKNGGLALSSDCLDFGTQLEIERVPLNQNITATIWHSKGISTFTFSFKGIIEEAKVFLSNGLLFNIIGNWADSKTILFALQNKTNEELILYAAKLELGSRQTLAHQENGVWVLNEIPDFAEELRKCQRYLLWGQILGQYAQQASGTSLVFISTPVSFRAGVRVEGTVAAWNVSDGGLQNGNATLTVAQIAPNGIYVNVVGTPTPVDIVINGGLSAEF